MKLKFFEFYLLKEYLRPWLGLISSLFFLFFLGAIGYRFTEGWDWGDCLWMVLITVSTIGFGEVQPLSPEGRIVTLLIIVAGLIFVQFTFQKAVRLFELGYFQRVNELRFKRILRKMKDHVILCGYGRVGQEISKQIKTQNIPIIVVENDTDRKKIAEENGLEVLFTDATLDETLNLAGLNTCKSLVVTLPNDAANLYVVLSAKSIRNSVKVIARAGTEESASKLRLAGANIVVSPYIAAGRAMASMALRPIAIDFLDLLAGSECEIEEFELSNDISLFENSGKRTLLELGIGKKSGAKILAIKEDQKLITNPGGEFLLQPGQILITFGSRDQLDTLAGLLGNLVTSAELLK
ncbi:uncharacterized protein METZ01_LOCUS285308 [marine metagenome]|uniref:RCK N-terminal domain-containing protein n=1 Tax=marine metagenome TaxID=408172 RepID=A0A382L690_9ZZZZ